MCAVRPNYRTRASVGFAIVAAFRVREKLQAGDQPRDVIDHRERVYHRQRLCDPLRFRDTNAGPGATILQLMKEQARRESLELDLNTRLALERTRVAYERTMQAWIRTAISLITFGFSINKFFQIETRPGEKTPYGPYIVSTLMVVIGLIALFVATLEHRRNVRSVYYPGAPRSLALPVAALISLLGIVALVSMFLSQ